MTHDFGRDVMSHFDLHQNLRVETGDTLVDDPWEPCHLNYVPLVRGNSVMDLNLGLHLNTDAFPPTDWAPLDLEESALEGQVCQTDHPFLPCTFSF